MNEQKTTFHFRQTSRSSATQQLCASVTLKSLYPVETVLSLQIGQVLFFCLTS